MSGQSNITLVVPPCRHKHLRSLGYTISPPSSVVRKRFPLSLQDFEGLQVVSQATPPLLWPPPPMHIITNDETTLQQGSWEAVELLVEQETRKQESARRMVIATLSHPVMAVR